MSKLFLSVLLLSPAVFGYVALEAKCAPAQVRPDQGYSVAVTRNQRSLLGGRTEPFWSAQVMENTIAGPRTVIIARSVGRRQVTRPGAPLEYIGREFRLAVQMTVAPRPDHKHPAVLNAIDDNGNEIEEQLLCEIAK
jgi:hypothetical protein